MIKKNWNDYDVMEDVMQMGLREVDLDWFADSFGVTV